MTDPEQMAVLLPRMILSFTAVFLAAALAYGRRVEQKKKEALAQLSRYFDGAPTRRFFVQGFSGRAEGLPFSVDLLPGSKNSPARLCIAVGVLPRFELAVYRESLGMALTKAIGLEKDIETCDPQFNKDFVLSAAAGGQAEYFLNEEMNRDIIRRFFDAGYEYLKFGKDGVSAVKAGYDLEADLEPAVLADKVKTLAGLAGKVSA